MPSKYRVGVVVPVAEGEVATAITQRLQKATTIQPYVGAWVVLRRKDERFIGCVLVDFTIEAETQCQAQELALTWVRGELDRGQPIEGVGEPALAEAAS